MKVKEISVTVKYVKNMGNFQSYAAEASATVQVEGGESAEAVYDKAWEMVKDEVRETINQAK